MTDSPKQDAGLPAVAQPEQASEQVPAKVPAKKVVTYADEVARLRENDIAYVSELQEALIAQKTTASSVLLILIAAIFSGALIWAYFARVEEVTRGEAKIIPSSREQVIQSLEGGILEQMNVREGDVVEAGQVLLKIDPTRAGASYRETESKVLGLKGMLARLRAEAYGQKLVFPADVQAVPSIVESETEAYNARRQMLDEGISGLQQSLSLAEGELKVSEQLARKGLISDVEILRMRRAANELRIQMSERRNKYRSDANADLTRAESELAQSVENLAGREDIMKRTTLTSPMKGIVKNVRVTTIGGVIQQGQDIMEIVPLEDRLLVEAKVLPSDVAFLRPGLPATVKISAYDYAIYGGLKGKVELISPDTIKDDEKSRQGKPDSYYRVLIRTDAAELVKGDKHFPIIPGMTAMADIRTGEKTILDYLLKPALKAREAFRER
ncbi:HlyD family type I secretion periplasmic adaptor subunit [Pseudomonas nitroreducens]|uniref:HlyD family type I secretion periplasmic adaptor subunit n=1 Tax=Pseudomonas nitroreducens TaxID=46680 RepID=UPI00265AEB16|nr:HlyD family type I secretion periplasmic adaptor subunit [Pseudomonas nitroreducens]MCP1648833.1 adhesin transport system membrane fusion protein [Pseudomonas nitroreducens]MCP1685206.1 adhesin transport system membrane fusion protein [Pseudomonas nitroreducens]